MAIAAAAAVSVAATAASAAMQLSKKKGGGGGLAGAGYVGPGPNERLFNRGTRDILDAERLILDDAAAQGKFIEPELYRALGLEPVYDRPEDPEYQRISEQLANAQNRLNEIRQERVQIQVDLRKKGKKGKLKKKGGRRAIVQIDRESSALNKDITTLTRELELRGAVGRRVVGFKPLGGVADPTGSADNAFGGALDQFNAHLASALAGKEPLDPTLKSAFDEKERILRERLRRQMGPDYETSTAGANALANFDRERAEAFAQYNTQAIGYFSGLAEHRAGSLQELTTGRLRNLMLPATFRSTLANELGGAARDRAVYTESQRAERQGQGQAQARIAEARAAEAEQRRQALQDLLGRTAAAAQSPEWDRTAAALLGTAGTAEGPRGSEFDTAGALGAGGRLSPSAGTLFGR